MPVIILLALTHPVFGFQNFFNVPSSQITPKGKNYYQQQVNIYEKFEASGHYVHGLGTGFETGVTFSQLRANWPGRGRLPGTAGHGLSPDSNSGPVALWTLQKQFVLSDVWSVAVGSKLGLRPSTFSKQTYASRQFAHLVYEPKDWIHGRLVLGPYFANKEYLDSSQDATGIQGGVEIEITPQEWFFLTDFILGANYLGSYVIGGGYWFNETFNVCLGQLIPYPGSGNSHAAVVELTWTNF